MKKLVFIFFLLAAYQCHSQTLRYSVTYSLGGEPSLRKESISYVERELRSLGDVDIKPKDGFYRLSLIIMSTPTENGRIYIISITVAWRTSCLKNVVDAYPCYVFDDHTLFTGGDLKELISKTITDFDINSLAPLRKTDLFKP